MITQVVQFKKLNSDLKSLIHQDVNPDDFVYVYKDNKDRVKYITNSILSAIQKTQKP